MSRSERLERLLGLYYEMDAAEIGQGANLQSQLESELADLLRAHPRIGRQVLLYAVQQRYPAYRAARQRQERERAKRTLQF